MNYLIDASIYIFQYYFSLPDHWESEEGYPTAAVYGYTTFLLRLLEQEIALQPNNKVALCFDESLGSCFRNEIYLHYKSSRALPDDALAFQLNACREVSELLGIQCFSSDTHEADDFIGSLTRKLHRHSQPIAILSRDKDLGQLLKRPQDFLWDYAKDQRSYASDIHVKFGVHPQQMVDYLALVGDSIDDIPGVPGLGPKTAQGLLAHFVGVDQLLKVLEKQGVAGLQGLNVRGIASMAEKILVHREQIRMAQQLARIVTDLPLKVPMTELRWHKSKVKMKRLHDFCGRMGFPRLNARITSLF